MKALIEQFLQNQAAVLAVIGVLGTVAARLLQVIFAHYQDRKEVIVAKRTIPIATDVFWIVEKAYKGSTDPNKSALKALMFAEKFLSTFTAAWGAPPDEATAIAGKVKGDLLTALNAGDAGKN